MSQDTNSSSEQATQEGEQQQEQQQEQQEWKSKGNRALVINIIFFIILFGSIFLIPVTGFEVAIGVIAIAFVASILYIYLV